MAGLTKSALLATLAEKNGVSKNAIGMFLNSLTELAYAQVKKNGVFNLPGLGKLVKKNRAARTARNPATGAAVQVPAKTVVKFRVAKAAKEAVL